MWKLNATTRWSKLLPLQRDLAGRERNLREKQVAALQRTVAGKKEDRIRTSGPRSPARSGQLASGTARAGRAKRDAGRTAQEAGRIDHRDHRRSHCRSNATLAELEADFKNIQEKVRYAGNSSSIGLVLRKKRDELPDTRKCEQRIRFVARVMPEANLARMEFQEERTTLGDLDAAAGDAIANLDRSLAASRGQQYLEETVRELLEKKRDLLDKLINGYDQYLTKLSELEIGNRKLVAKTEEVAGYVDERVLWVRSADVLGPSARDGGGERFASVWLGRGPGSSYANNADWTQSGGPASCSSWSRRSPS